MHRIVIPLSVVWLLFACGAETTVEIVTPSADLATRNGTVNLQISVDGDKPDRLELWRNGVRWLELQEPYAYAWHTDSEPEGRYELVARAVRGDQHQESSIRVVQLGAEGWESPQVVNVLETRTASGRPTLAVSGEDLYVAFGEVVPAQGENLYVKRQQGGVWSPVGGPVDRTLANSVAFPAIAVDDAGLPMVAFCEVSGSEVNIQAARWFGHWSYAQVNGDPISTSGFFMEFDLVQSQASGPVAVYSSRVGSAERRLHVARFASSRWEPVATPLGLRDGRDAFLPSARFDASGTLWVSWSEYNDGDGTDVVVARYNGTLGEN